MHVNKFTPEQSLKAQVGERLVPATTSSDFDILTYVISLIADQQKLEQYTTKLKSIQALAPPEQERELVDLYKQLYDD